MEWINVEGTKRVSHNPFLGIIKGVVSLCQFDDDGRLYSCCYPADFEKPFKEEDISKLRYWMPLPETPKE